MRRTRLDSEIDEGVGSRGGRSSGLGQRPTRLIIATAIAVAGLCSMVVSVSAKEPWRPSEVFEWSAPSPEEQLAADQTRVPEGMGALFLPSLTAMSDEPELLIFRGHSQVATGEFGQRVILEPGSYTVRVGSGSLRQMLSIPAEVQADETTLVPVTWGGLRIEVINENRVPHRGSYELIQVESRDIFGIGYGADTLVGERLTTWVLPAGLYRVVQPGATYRSRTNFSTVYVPPGALVRYQLVMDPETNEFLGAGIVSGEEMSVPEGKDENWIFHLLIGINGSLSVNQDLVGTPNQTSLSGEGFLDASGGFHDSPNHFTTLLQVEEGLLWINPETGDALPVQKSRDRVRLDLLYTYDIFEALGPYVRLGTRISMFPAEVLTTQEVTVTRNHLDGSSETEAIQAGDAFRTAGYFGDIALWEGVGVNWRALRHLIGQLDIGVGVGFRQYSYRDFYAEAETSSAPDLVYNEIDSYNQEGLESIISGNFRLTLLNYTTHFEVFADFTEFRDPTLEWENTLGLRLLEFLSLDYRFDLLRQPQVSEKWQMAHNLLLRFSWELL